MSVLSKDDFLNRIKAKIGEDTSDDNIAFIEDMTDTFNDLEGRANDSGNWKEKYDNLDASWRKKYTERFFSGSPENDPDPQPQPNPTADVTFDDLFETK